MCQPTRMRRQSQPCLRICFKIFYAHENNTDMERPELLCTEVDMTNLKKKMQKMDIYDHCTK